MRKLVFLFILIAMVFIINPAQAGLLDLINPAVMGARASAAEMREEAIKLNQPTGLFGAYWGMLEQDFLNKFKQCSKLNDNEVAYKEYRMIENTNVAVTYIFKKGKNGKIAALMQIILVPVINYKSIEELHVAYTLFRDYISKNISELSPIEYIKDQNGNITKYNSYATFKYSQLTHFVELHQGRVVHAINFFKTKKK